MICLFGGTFDPVHNGHLHAAAAAADALGAETVRMVLSARPPHKNQLVASIEQRWDMLQSACANDSRFVPDDIEVQMAGPGYTVNILAAIRARYQQERLFWVVGSDAFRELRTWFRWQDIMELTHLVVVAREHATLDPDMQAFFDDHRVDEVPDTPTGSIYSVKTAMLDVSATMVRERIAVGAAAGHLLPGGVCTYISTHGLYLETDERKED